MGKINDPAIINGLKKGISFYDYDKMSSPREYYIILLEDARPSPENSIRNVIVIRKADSDYKIWKKYEIWFEETEIIRIL